MNDSFYALPWYTSYWWVVGVFCTLCAFFHAALVWIWPLSSIAWKQVDYIWLGMAFIGIAGSVGAVRSVVLANLSSSAQFQIKAGLHSVEQAAAVGTSPGVCRVFNRTSWSPPVDALEHLQREYDAQCAWFRRLGPKLGELATSPAVEIDLATLVGPPPPGGDQGVIKQLQHAVLSYNSAVSTAQSLHDEKSILLELIQVLGPTLFAAALALRITKVTGEVRIERRRTI